MQVGSFARLSGSCMSRATSLIRSSCPSTTGFALWSPPRNPTAAFCAHRERSQRPCLPSLAKSRRCTAISTTAIFSISKTEAGWPSTRKVFSANEVMTTPICSAIPICQRPRTRIGCGSSYRSSARIRSCAGALVALDRRLCRALGGLVHGGRRRSGPNATCRRNCCGGTRQLRLSGRQFGMIYRLYNAPVPA